MAETLPLDSALLVELRSTRMPYGKFKGSAIADIPEHYLLWMARTGFPPGRLGQLLALMYEIRLNGLEGLLKQTR